MPKRIEVKPNSRFNLLVTIKEVRTEYGERKFLCKCDCGKKCIRTLKALRKIERVSSCGCYHTKQRKSPKPERRSENHTYLKTRLYSIWCDIKKRCYSKTSRAYKWYGAKGITVCDEWKDKFLNFRNWAIKNGYSPQLTIERINHNGNYEPSNCKWIPWSEQNNNKSNSVIVKYNGSKICLGKLVKSKGLKYQTVVARLKRGWSVKDAIDKPTIKAKKYNYKGSEKTVREWSDIYNIKYSVVIHRLSVGWTIEKALTKPVKQKNK